MADTGIFATTAEVQNKVGANASTTYNAETYINQYISEAESLINILTEYNWSDNFAALNVDYKQALQRAASVKAAMDVINADLSGFFSLAEAQTRLNKLDNDWNECISLLKEKAQYLKDQT